jgi:hypothetical protein
VIYTRDDLRPTPTYPTYPPYHRGAYLEDYFYNKFIKDNPEVNRDYIAISWTTLYCENKDKNIQSFLDSLDQSKQYFTVLQHDDAPRHRLPPNTICFSAGGNVQGNNIIPIPLICSKLDITNKNLKKETVASFVGSLTHPIRLKMATVLSNDKNYQIWLKHWSPSIDKNEFELFIDCAVKSKFLLCPRGYGLNSFRLYESFQIGCVPVIITDNPYLPWEDEINWNDFSILITEKDIPNIKNILENIDDKNYQKLLKNGQSIYLDYFSMDGLYNNIIKRLK